MTPDDVKAPKAGQTAANAAPDPEPGLSGQLAALRAELSRRGLDGFVVPRADAHQGEYVAPGSERLAWLTGFTGSAGMAVILAGRAALFVCGQLGWPWRAAAVLKVLPTFVLDFGYGLIARCRYLVFGKLDTCPVPPPEHRARFLG